MKYCIKCGSEMADAAMFCPSCGTQAEVSATAQTNFGATVQTNTNQYIKGMKAIGGLKIWLWIIIVSCSLYAIYSLYLAYSYRWFGSSTVLLFIGLAIVLMVEVFGASRLLNGFKQGLYILCGCVGASLIFDAISGGVSTFIQGIIYGAISLGILWLLAKKQWEYFQ